MSRGLRWYVFERVEGTDEYDITSWSRTKEAARAKVEKSDPKGGRIDKPVAFQVYAKDRPAARKEAAEVWGVKVAGYLSPEAKKLGQAIVKGAVMRAIFCPYTGQVLDMRRAVYVAGRKHSYVMAAAHWDSLSESSRSTIRANATVYDGRELFKRG
jgi:hypothetical protein